MYAAKRQGKGRHETYAPAMHAAAVARFELAGEIRRALELREFTVHYQPAVRLRDGSIAGFEALVRWNHPHRGLVLPGDFIHAAEETGQIIAIGRFVLDEACRQARAWHDGDGRGPARTMSVNVSARQFRDPSLCPSVAAALEGAGLDPSLLVVEITESIAMEDSDEALRRLSDLKELGVRLAIDDFGTGYSSLSYLRRLPVDILKIDKSFVDGIASGGQSLELARMIVGMGRTLHLDTVAEGVELASQAAALRQMGCGQAQGFHFARPMAPDHVTALLSHSAKRLPRAG
jgi:EAL domain-containing protein (putative c-di-GMP-specific phosphodiesterase class I)